jgi:hypothetical protein
MKTNIGMFKELCKMSQKGLKKNLAKRLRETYAEVKVEDGYVFAKGEFPVLLVAHMDTVHKDLPQFFLYDNVKKSLSSPQGIGGDDRCGIYMILQCIQKYNCSVLFCEDEEIGTVGASKFAEAEWINDLDFNYIIEFDRRGNNDAVFYDCDNDDFETFITKEFYKTTWGSFSDISVIAPALGCAAVNLSCGYYGAHTKDEYVVLPEMEASIEAACKILERTTEEDKFEYIEAVHVYKYSSKYGYDYGYDWFDDGYYGSYGDIDEKYFIIEYVDRNGDTQWYDTEAFSKEEAVGRFCMAHPKTPFIDIIDISSGEAYK